MYFILRPSCHGTRAPTLRKLCRDVSTQSTGCVARCVRNWAGSGAEVDVEHVLCACAGPTKVTWACKTYSIRPARRLKRQTCTKRNVCRKQVYRWTLRAGGRGKQTGQRTAANKFAFCGQAVQLCSVECGCTYNSIHLYSTIVLCYGILTRNNWIRSNA